MNHTQLANQIDQLVGSGKTEQALHQAIEFLATGSRYRALYRIALNTKALFEKTRQSEQRGLITGEAALVQFNLINDTLLKLADDIREQRLVPQGFDERVSRRRGGTRSLLLVIALVLLAIAGGLWFYLRSDAVQCPGFPGDSQLNVLLLPFKNLRSGDLRPEYSIKERLDDLALEHQLETSTQVFERYYQQQDAQLPDFELATRIGDDCRAKLIVWGTAESLSNGQIDVSSKFKFLGEASQPTFQKIKLEGETQIDTIPSVSSIAREGNLTKDIEDLILTLFGLIAHEQGDYQASIDALEQSSRSGDTSSFLLTQMALADSYLATQQTDKALQQYDRVLEVHPDYSLARNNRGILLYEKGNFQEAVQDFSNILQRNPEDSDVLVARGAAFAKLNEMDKAKTDLNEARRINPDRRIFDLKNIRPGIIPALMPKPKLFTSYAAEFFHPIDQSKALTLDREEGHTHVLSGQFLPRALESTHQIKVTRPAVSASFFFKAAGEAPMTHQLVDSYGKNYFPSSQQDVGDISLPPGEYTLRISRPQAGSDLYYEVLIVY
ncbi:MAG: tetratricopeptide repeat protein [Saprospiraceae bacterium]|nr:tetratricopeptide repeat protein [Saprospiraceae bacterium]